MGFRKWGKSKNSGNARRVGRRIKPIECGQNRGKNYACPAECSYCPWTVANYSIDSDLLNTKELDSLVLMVNLAIGVFVPKGVNPRQIGLDEMYRETKAIYLQIMPQNLSVSKVGDAFDDFAERALGFTAPADYTLLVTLTLPDLPITARMSGAELRLELACALYSRGRISAVAGSHLAEIDLVAFQGALADRDIPRSYSVSDLHSDLAAMDRILGV